MKELFVTGLFSDWRYTITDNSRVVAFKDGFHTYLLAEAAGKDKLEQLQQQELADIAALQAENARLRGELDAAREALENIVDYDVQYEHGYIDEWTEAASFTIVRNIARNALEVKGDHK